MWGLSSQTRDQTHVPCIGRQILNHWTAREVPTIITDNNAQLGCHCSFCALERLAVVKSLSGTQGLLGSWEPTDSFAGQFLLKCSIEVTTSSQAFHCRKPAVIAGK